MLRLETVVLLMKDIKPLSLFDIIILYPCLILLRYLFPILCDSSSSPSSSLSPFPHGAPPCILLLIAYISLRSLHYLSGHLAAHFTLVFTPGRTEDRGHRFEDRSEDCEGKIEDRGR